jgi:hypothetical protein
MSQCDFPRIHVRGLININVGTANNDDYAGDIVVPTYQGGNPDNPLDMASYSKLPLRLADTDQVQPTTFGRSDNEFHDWASQSTPSRCRAEWLRARRHSSTAGTRTSRRPSPRVATWG